MIFTRIFCTLALLGALPVYANEVWLVVGASDTSAKNIAQKAKQFTQHFPAGLIFRSSDCGNKKNVFGWSATVTTSKSEADKVLASVKKTVKDAYLKNCKVKPNSLLSLRLPAIDPSISDVPNDVVNWGDEDRISSIHTLANGMYIAVIRYYSPTKDDPLEGRRERVVLIQPKGKKIILEQSCTDANEFSIKGGFIALQCAREQAGDNLMHSILVFDTTTGKKQALITHCRKPKWQSDSVITCSEESVDADGVLALHKKKVNLTKR